MQLFGKIHCSVWTITSNSRCRYFLLELQAVKASPRKSASPNIEHLWKDFTKVPPSSSTHPESDGHVNTVRNPELNWLEIKLPSYGVYPRGELFSWRSYCLYIEIPLSFFFSFLLDHYFQTGPQSSLTSSFLCQLLSAQSPRNFLSTGRISIILQATIISDLKEYGWEPTGWFSAVTSEKSMGF